MMSVAQKAKDAVVTTMKTEAAALKTGLACRVVWSLLPLHALGCLGCIMRASSLKGIKIENKNFTLDISREKLHVSFVGHEKRRRVLNVDMLSL